MYSSCGYAKTERKTSKRCRFEILNSQVIWRPQATSAPRLATSCNDHSPDQENNTREQRIMVLHSFHDSPTDGSIIMNILRSGLLHASFWTRASGWKSVREKYSTSLLTPIRSNANAIAKEADPRVWGNKKIQTIQRGSYGVRFLRFKGLPRKNV